VGRATACVVAALAAGTSGLAGCGGSGDPAGDPTLRVYVSVPLSGAEAETGRQIARGAREALTDGGGEAAGVRVRAVILDSGRDGAEGDDPIGAAARAGANAREAVQDSTAIGYVGEVDSASTRTSLPITNDARLLQISPSADASYLVAPFEGSDEVPEATQPSGVRTFGTLGGLRGSPRELGGEAMALVLAAVSSAEDPLDRASAVDAFFALGERDSRLGRYEIAEIGVAERR
jgi:hypothetical protein